MTSEKLVAIAEEAVQIPVPNWMRLDENAETAYYRFLYLLAQEVIPPANIVELGTWRGVSAMCLAEGAQGSKVYTYDISPQVIEAARRPNIHYVVGDSRNIEKSIENIQILFIDTSHEGPLALAEFNAWLPMLSRDAVVLFDDVNLNDSMRQFWDGFMPQGFLKMNTELHGKVGFGVLLRSTDDDGDKKQ